MVSTFSTKIIHNDQNKYKLYCVINPFANLPSWLDCGQIHGFSWGFIWASCLKFPSSWIIGQCRRNRIFIQLYNLYHFARDGEGALTQASPPRNGLQNPALLDRNILVWCDRLFFAHYILLHRCLRIRATRSNSGVLENFARPHYIRLQLYNIFLLLWEHFQHHRQSIKTFRDFQLLRGLLHSLHAGFDTDLFL